MMMAGLSVEASQYAVAKMQLQYAADTAAMAGVITYANSRDPKLAANAAANMAEINGVTGVATRVWSDSTNVLTDNNATVTVGAGILSTNNVSVQVVVKRAVTNSFSSLFNSASSTTISAIAAADAVPASTGGQPCVVALGSSSSALTVWGSANINAINCTLRSNGGISYGGSGTISADAHYAASAISVGSSASVTGTLVPNAGTIEDPYATFKPVQDALAKLKPGTGTAYSLSGNKSVTIDPGTYASITVTSGSSLTLNPGLYIVNGDISFAGSSTVTGNGVTIIASGTITYSGSSYVTLTAATTSTTSGAIPGVIFAGTSTNSSNMQGTGTQPVTGVIYYPKGSMTYAGNAQTNGCAEVIALTVTITGNSSVESSCHFYGTQTFSSSKLSYTAKLAI